MSHRHDTRPTPPRETLALTGAVSLLSWMLVFSGCTVGPDFTRPEAKVNENWNENGDPRVGQTAVDAQWWRAFRDPTLDRLIELAYQQNLPLQITGLRIMEARARLAIALGQQLPQQQEAYGSATDVGLSKNAPNGALEIGRAHV